MSETERRRFLVGGAVQGVGFRPFVYALATELGLVGFALNDTDGVSVEVEGAPGAIESFEKRILSDAPQGARQNIIRCEDVSPVGDTSFCIKESKKIGNRWALPGRDLSVCDKCINELKDKSNRRWEYPFIGCSQCGPRFTITHDIPYDRELTSMTDFPQCEKCLDEYKNFKDRRLHSQQNTCDDCGPGVSLTDGAGNTLSYGKLAIQEASQFLQDGKILAVKGVGGFHLACDARKAESVRTLRSRKKRPDKPFAVMTASLEHAKEICFINEKEENLLTGLDRPIVILDKKMDAQIPDDIAPGCDTIGVMLPYTPLHILLHDASVPYLVMTSGNISDEPVVYTNVEALERLGNIADYFLMHNRDILICCDDSVVRSWTGGTQFIRRSRGYVPEPVSAGINFQRNILACGAEQKNVFAMTRGNEVVPGQHIGDLESMESVELFEKSIAHFKKIMSWEPSVIAHDMHPEYISTKYARKFEGAEAVVAVQHHHAHVAGCLAEHGEHGPAIGVSFDGLGFGLDKTFWGGEFLIFDRGGFIRIGHLKETVMPGGAAAVKNPWRMALAWLQTANNNNEEIADLLKGISRDELELVSFAASRGVNSPVTTSAGRLFDATSSLILNKLTVSYEGQAAIELEVEAKKTKTPERRYRFEIKTMPGLQRSGTVKEVGNIDDITLVANPVAVLSGIMHDMKDGVSSADMAAAFHLAVADMIVEMCSMISEKVSGLKTVVLSGGVFQNRLLLETVVQLLSDNGFRVLTNERVPPNDGGISFGQAVVAEEVMRRNKERG